MNLENPANVKCQKCKCYRTEASFYNEKGRRLKSCQNCRDTAKKSRDKQKCEHDRRRNHCKICGGSSICEHERIRSQCKICGGSSICEHDRQRSKCKICGGASICEHDKERRYCKICSDPIRITIKNMISSAKYSDKKYNRYDAVNFVDKCFVKNLLEDYTHCYYEDCKRELQIMDNNNSLVSLERINNNLGHIKSNCVICCLSCNHARKSNSTTE